MLGMSDLLDRQDCGTEQRHTALAYLRRACGALLEMVDDITDHASLEQGDVRLRCRTFDLPACLRACADLYRPAAEGKGLELLLHLAPHLPRQVRGDSFRLRQALGNLVSNAVKFTERGRVDVEAGGERLASGVFLLRLDVRDSGPGLEPGEERTVFESFCRGSAAGGKPGTGLGLNIVRTIARRMGGDVQVRSCPGQGCTFTLEVRLKIVEGGPGPQPGHLCPAEKNGAAPATAAGPLQGLRVLVAEDDAAGRYLLEVRLREQGCTVGLAADGEQVLDMLAATPWDVILLDAGMPRMDGLTVLERIRAGQSAASRQQAVIVHSAGLAPGEEARFRALGVRALLDKPVPPAMLLAALRDVPRGCPGDGQAGPTPCGAEAEAPVIWDRAAALAAADQDEELLHTLVTALREDLPRLDAALAAARKLAADPAVPAARTAEALRRAAHALKNSAATLCFEELRLRAAALEQAARQVLADTPENAAGLGSLAAACAGALARAEEALRRDNG